MVLKPTPIKFKKNIFWGLKFLIFRSVGKIFKEK